MEELAWRERLRRARRAFAGSRPAAVPRVPKAGPGTVVAPPDYVGVGVMKAGTTWWARLINRHPGVHRTGRKELHYFDGFCARPFTAADADRYARYFPRPPGLLAGEWTPRYLFDFWTPPLLAAAAPGARILVLLRDPVERYRSGLAHDLARGYPAGAELAQDHFNRGLYHQQLTRLLDHVPREALLVLQYERCVADPAAELARTYRHLGLDPAFRPDTLVEAVFETRSPKPALDERVRDALLQAYAADTRALAADFPEIDRDLWA